MDDESEAITVVQHLEPEQYLYEFPSKTCLRALAYLDSEQEEYSFFDESSFASSTTAYSSAFYYEDTMCMDDDWHETDEDDQLVEDGRLSPLELPAPNSRPSCDSVETVIQSADCVPVGPSSFLSDVHKGQMYDHHVTHLSKGNMACNVIHCLLVSHIFFKCIDYSDSEYEHDMQVFCNESEPIMDSSDDFDSVKSSSSIQSRIVLIKLNKHKPMTLTQRCPTSLTYLASDEGYGEGDEYNEELESHCVFYPLGDHEDTEDVDFQQDRSAIKIQAAWRGYCSRRQNKKQFPCKRADQRVIMNLAQLCGKIHHRQMSSVNDRLVQLEQRVREETAMRMAFEKAMEDMTVLIDQQQKILYDRLEQEIHMRQVYENKFNNALDQLQPLESRLRKEVSARNKMEEMMTRVLDQMHDAETSRQLQQKEDAESKTLMQSKLDRALEDIATIKKASTVKSTVTSRPSTINLVKKNNISTTTTAIFNKSSRTDSIRTSPPSIRRSIVPTNKSTITPNRRQPRSLNIINSKNLDTSHSNKPVGSLIERPSVIPSNRRPLDQSIRRPFK